MDAIETRRRPACDIEHGYDATSMCLLAMIALKLGRSVKWDGATGQILNDPQAAALLRRPYRAPWIYPEG